MAAISTAVLTTWETPETIESLGTEIKQHAASFKAEVEDAGLQWNRLQSAYSGPGQETLYAALDPVVTQGEFISDAGELAHGALEEFVSSLRTLRQERTELLAQVGDFNREHSGDSFDDLDSTETTGRSGLVSALQSLQQRYEDLAGTCAAALNQIRVGNVSDGELDNTTALDELTSWSNYASDTLNVFDAQTTVEGLEEIQVTRDGNVMSEQLVDSYEERSHRLTMFGEPVGSGTPANAWNTLLADSGVGANPTTTPMERLRTQFMGRFMDALPGAGLGSSALATFGRQGTTTSQRNPGRVTTSTDSQGRNTQSQVRHTQETRSGQLRNAGNFALRGGWGWRCGGQLGSGAGQCCRFCCGSRSGNSD